MDLLSNTSILQRALDTSSKRQKVITNNIANVDTPGYKTKEVSFQDILDKKQAKQSSFFGARTNEKHITIGGKTTGTYEPTISVQNETSRLNNKNNVDIEHEMTKMAENNIWYNSLTQVINKEFSMLRYVITEGRR